jgi:hypothetical protein
MMEPIEHEDITGKIWLSTDTMEYEDIAGKPIVQAPAPKKIKLSIICAKCGRKQEGKILITRHREGKLESMVAETSPCECSTHGRRK